VGSLLFSAQYQQQPVPVEGDKTKKQKFATYPIGYFHIDIAEVQPEDGKLYMFVAVDRTSKFAYAELHPRATRTIAKDFLDNLIKAVPYNPFQHNVGLNT
jgi:hypothetical protein